MAATYPRSTPESKAIASLLPGFIDHLPHSTAPGRVTSAYHSPDPDSTAFDDAFQKYLDKKAKDSIPLFRKLLDEYPRSALRFKAKYWLAQAMLRNKQDADARKLLLDLQQSSPLSYYGLLASIASGQDLETPLGHDAPLAQDGDPMLLPTDLMRLRRAQALFSRKIYDSAAIELSEIRPREALSTPFLIYLSSLQSEAGAHPAAFRTLNEIILRGSPSMYNEFGLSQIFPTENFEEIQRIAAEFQLDPILVLSLVKQESAFDSHAISSTGALGLMQIMPATASDTVADLARVELIVPETNIRTGMKYLSQLLRRYNGNIVFALAAYNAGPGAVNRWIKGSPPDRGIAEFIEEIPFRETRDYVSSIIRNYFWYARLLAPETAKLVKINHFWGSMEPTPVITAGPLAPYAASTPKPLDIPPTAPLVAQPLPSASPATPPSTSPSVFPSVFPAVYLSASPVPSKTPEALPSPSTGTSPAPAATEYGPAISK
jgi:soluble lytic murein transglycosylase-like protein